MNQPDVLISLERRNALPFAARQVCRLLERIEHGWLLMTLPNGELLSFGHHGEPVEMRVKDWATFDHVIARGDIGLGEAWFDGLWDSDHLARVLTPNSRRIIEQDTVQLDRAGRAGGRRRQSPLARAANATSVVWTSPLAGES